MEIKYDDIKLKSRNCGTSQENDTYAVIILVELGLIGGYNLKPQ